MDIFLFMFYFSSAERMQTLEGDRIGRGLTGYVGYPLTDSVNDSGADLRILGTQFSSTDQGSEAFRRSRKVADLYK